MAVRATTWSPDTCRCVVEYLVDDTNPDVLVYNQHLATCSVHGALPQGNGRWDAVVDEVRSRSVVRAAVAEAVPGLDLETSLEITYRDVYVGAGRGLRVALSGITGQQRGQAQAAIAALIASGKVVLA